MIECKLKELLQQLPPSPKPNEEQIEDEPQAHQEVSLRGHAEAAGMGWQQFSGLLHNKTVRPSLKNLQKLRDYLAEAGVIEPGQVRFLLGDILDERGLTRIGVSKDSGVSHSPVNRMANNLMLQANYDLMERLLIYLGLESLEEMLDTGGLLVWKRN